MKELDEEDLDDQGISTALEIEQDDSNIERIHERRTLLNQGKKRIKSPSCRSTLCKALIICCAAVIFILMMVEVWNDYGSYITTKSLRPQLYSMSESCPFNKTGIFTKNYNPPSCEYTSGEIGMLCNITLPSHHFIEVQQHYHAKVILNVSDGFYVEFNKNHTECTYIKIWNI